MSENAHQTLETEKPQLLRKASDNRELCSFFMSLVYHSITRAHELGTDFSGVRFTAPQWLGDALVFQIKFDRKRFPAATRRADPLNTCRELRDFLAKRNMAVVTALDENPEYFRMLDRLVTAIERKCSDEKRDFTMLAVAKGIVERGTDKVVLEMSGGLLV